MWTTFSKDGGVTWFTLRDSGLDGSTPSVVTAKDGLVVAVYIRRATHPGGGGFKRTGVYASLSRDNGASWDSAHQVSLLDTGTATVDGYPDSVALPDGTVYTAFGYQGANAIGGIRFDPRHPAFGVAEK